MENKMTMVIVSGMCSVFCIVLISIITGVGVIYKKYIYEPELSESQQKMGEKAAADIKIVI